MSNHDIGQQHRDREIRMRFMRISEPTGSALREFWPAVEKALPAILEGFYNHLLSEPNLAKLVGNDMARLKGAQGTHWGRLFNGRFDETYIQGVRTIGMVHNKIGLEPRWYIGGYAFVLSHLTDLALRTYRWKSTRAAQVITAVNSAVMLDMDFAISVYQEAMLEDRAKRQRVVDDLIKSFDKTITEIVGSVSSAATELQSTAQSLSSTAEEASRQSNAVAAASEQMTQNVQTVASATEELSASIREISNQVTESTRIVGEAVAQAEDTNGKVKSLSEAAQKIGEVVTLINEIASQTNLLALNATIEAARAGEAGKGFAVVASEVKNLATQTAKATEEIAGQVKAIQESTDSSAQAIGSITQTINRVSEISTAIASAVEEQGAATQEIARNVQEAASGTTEVTSNISGVTKASQQTSAGSTQVLGAASELAKNGARLRQEVETFLQAVRAA